MKTLFLLRHAKSSHSRPGLGDFDRPLNKRGRAAAAVMGRHLAGLWADPGAATAVPRPGLILCSAALRTQETLEILAQELPGEVASQFEDGLYLTGEAALAARIKRIADAVPAALLIGHNPGIQHLSLTLAQFAPASALDKMRDKFPTAALATFQAELESWAHFTPHHARLAGFVTPAEVAG